MNERLDFFLLPPDLTAVKYKIEHAKYFHYGVKNNANSVLGVGGDANSNLAQTKALFEMIERSIFHSVKKSKYSTSSGWAAHTVLEDAKKNSEREIFERDALMCSWLLRIAPHILGDHHYEIFEAKFPLLQFGRGADFFILGSVLELPQKKSRMLITTSCENIKEGLLKLEIDSERAYYFLSDNLSISDPLLKKHHNNFCLLKPEDLYWLYSNGSGIEYTDRYNFNYQIYEVPLWNASSAWVTNAQCIDLQHLYYGTSHTLNINRKRIRELNGGSIYKLNKNLHPLL